MKIKNTKVKTDKVKKIFSSIAKHYDLANKVITFGRDQAWRDELVTLSDVSKGKEGKGIEGFQILDCATGTGMLAFAFLKALGRNAKMRTGAKIIGIDFCSKMLEQAQKNLEKLKKKKEVLCEIYFKPADIHSIPFSDNTFDVSTIAYGLRNTQKPLQVLKEMARVTKPEGYVLILETGHNHSFLFRAIFNLYFRFIMPIMGGLITGKKSAYQYLQQSSFDFPSGRDFLHSMQQTKCFKKLEYKTLFLGASFIYKAQVSN